MFTNLHCHVVSVMGSTLIEPHVTWLIMHIR